MECETPLGEALGEDNSYSIVKTNNDERESLRRPETSILKSLGYISSSCSIP